jgi:predicted porin
MSKTLIRPPGLELFLPIVFFIAVFVPGKNAHAQSTSDAKLWAGFTGRVELHDRLRVDLKQQERFSFSDGAEKSISEAKLRARIHRYLRLAGAYRLIATGVDGFWHRGSADIGTGYDLGDLELSYRLRLQSTRRPNETVSSVRNKLSAQYDFSKGLKPEVAFELHYSTTNSEFREARLIAGIEKRLSKRVRVEAFYMFQAEFNKNTDENNHIVGLNLSYTFRRVKKKDKDISLDEPMDAGDTEPLR